MPTGFPPKQLPAPHWGIDDILNQISLGDVQNIFEHIESNIKQADNLNDIDILHTMVALIGITQICKHALDSQKTTLVAKDMFGVYLSQSLSLLSDLQIDTRVTFDQLTSYENTNLASQWLFSSLPKTCNENVAEAMIKVGFHSSLNEAFIPLDREGQEKLALRKKEVKNKYPVPRDWLKSQLPKRHKT